METEHQDSGKMKLTALAAACALMLVVAREGTAEVLCRSKKSGVVATRTACKKNELALGSVSNTASSSSAAAGTFVGTDLGVVRSGNRTGGADQSIGLDLSVANSGATGGSINTTGLNLSVVGDSGGDSTAVGLSVVTSGADVNYCAIFQGGNVGIGVSDPDEALEISGRLHLGQAGPPSDASDRLYNVGGTLFWNGQTVGVGSSGGSITAVNAGSGLVGGGSSGAVTLSVDTGTAAGKVVQLTTGGELPAVGGANLTSLNAGSLAIGTLPDSRLSSSVSLLGSTIGLSSEVEGTLPVTSGGTGAQSLSDLITLGVHTTGSYVASSAAGSGISIASGGASEGAALTISVDQAFTPSWSGKHSFSAGINVGTTTSSAEFLHLNGRLHLEPGNAPTVTTDKLYNVGGALFFNGINLSTNAAGGDITAVTAGTGLTGGATTGDATLAVDVGTAPFDIVQLNGTSQLPAVNGALLTSLNASNLATGTVADVRLSGNVSLLGPSIALGTEVSGILPIANGGTGASSFNDLIALGTQTTGVYVTSVTGAAGISVSPAGTEAITSTVSLDQSFSPTWTAQHVFSGVATDIATVSNQDFAIVPNGTGKVGIGTNVPTAKLDTSLASVATTGATEVGQQVVVADTGVISSGTDTTKGQVVTVTHTGASGGTIDSTGAEITVTGDGGGTSTATGLAVTVSGADTNYAALFSGGNVGIGTTAPSAVLDTVSSSTNGNAGNQVGAEINFSDTGVVTTGSDTGIGMDVNVTRTGSTGGTVTTTGIDLNLTADAGGGGTTTAVGLLVNAAGADQTLAARFTGSTVSIGSAVAVAAHANVPAGSLVVGNGALCVDNLDDDCSDGALSAGTIYADNATVAGVDVAEQFPIREGDTVEAGDIVMIDTSIGTKCLEDAPGPSGRPVCLRTIPGPVPFVTRAVGSPTEAKRAVGVVSTKPGVVLGGFAAEQLVHYEKVPVALDGRVPVKVSTESGPIELGDRISPSSVPGVGKRAIGSDISIGIALEPFDGIETGTVLVLVK